MPIRARLAQAVFSVEYEEGVQRADAHGGDILFVVRYVADEDVCFAAAQHVEGDIRELDEVDAEVLALALDPFEPRRK